MRRMTAILLVANIALVGCSSKKPEAAQQPAVFTTPCPAASPTAIPKKLPSGFPAPSEVTYTRSVVGGPSTFVYGYFAGDLTAAHQGYDDAFKAAGYTITSEEQDPADSEVNFKSSGSEGQVALKQECKGRVTVSITIRPLS